jgi:hypothetical protein
MNTADIAASIFSFIGLQEFQSLFNLPDDFELAQFYPQPLDIPADLEQVRAILDRIYQELLDTIPTEPPTTGWLEICLILQIRFRQLLNETCQSAKLDPIAIENAVIALGEVCQRCVNELLDAQTGIRELRPFSEIFSEWRRGSIRISEEVATFFRGDELWEIKCVEYAFGRLGLCVEMQGGTYFVYDPQWNCPSEGYLFNLLHQLMLEMQKQIPSTPNKFYGMADVIPQLNERG